ncbi:hypothetical protein XENOCAPTIV_023048 [Xenoophorus captivus]|uniref:Uncharacterized protein n=1 Tax=Xenoophorus captivus TaxID=1517983 RepID=A0ABV0RJW2_9TELE
MVLMMLGVFLLIFSPFSQISWGACPHVVMETTYRCGPFFLLPPPPLPPPPPPPCPPRELTVRPLDAPDVSLQFPGLRNIFLMISTSAVILLMAFNVCYKVLRRERDRTRENAPNNGGNHNNNNNNAESCRTKESASSPGFLF